MSGHAPTEGPGTVAELRALLAKATPGDWYYDDAVSGDGFVVMSGEVGRRVAHCHDGDGSVDPEKFAALIAALRNAAPDLLRVVEAAREVARCCFEEYECSRNTDPSNDDEYTTMMRPLWNELRAALEAVK